MVKRQRRMTKKKNSSAKSGLAKRSVRGRTKQAKGKKGLAKQSVRGPAKTDRANKAMKKLMKSIQKKRSDQ